MRNTFLHFGSPSFFEDDVEAREDPGAALWTLLVEEAAALGVVLSKASNPTAASRARPPKPQREMAKAAADNAFDGAPDS